jgi:23S rRNA (guanosine2251-2'-O)-methyltransferase
MSKEETPKDRRLPDRRQRPGKRGAGAAARGRPPASAGPRGRGAPERAPAHAERTASAELWFWGHHAVLAALRNPRRTCHLLLATEQALERLGRAAQRPGLEIRIAQPAEIARRLPPGAVHQGVALKVAPLPALSLDRVLAVQPEESLILVLDQITDPRNFGAILRSAVAMRASAVIVQERRRAEMAGAAARAAAGALDLIPIVEVTNLTRALLRLKESGYRVTALDAAAPTPIEELGWTPRRALVFGSEGEGIRRLVGETCDEHARIDVDPRIDSLNVSVAAGIALYVLERVLRRMRAAAPSAVTTGSG